MTWLYAITGIILIAFITSVSPKIGGLLIIIVVLGIWLTAKKKGMV